MIQVTILAERKRKTCLFKDIACRKENYSYTLKLNLLEAKHHIKISELIRTVHFINTIISICTQFIFPFFWWGCYHLFIWILEMNT